MAGVGEVLEWYGTPLSLLQVPLSFIAATLLEKVIEAAFGKIKKRWLRFGIVGLLVSAWLITAYFSANHKLEECHQLQSQIADAIEIIGREIRDNRTLDDVELLQLKMHEANLQQIMGIDCHELLANDSIYLEEVRIGLGSIRK